MELGKRLELLADGALDRVDALLMPSKQAANAPAVGKPAGK